MIRREETLLAAGLGPGPCHTRGGATRVTQRPCALGPLFDTRAHSLSNNRTRWEKKKKKTFCRCPASQVHKQTTGRKAQEPMLRPAWDHPELGKGRRESRFILQLRCWLCHDLLRECREVTVIHSPLLPLLGFCQHFQRFFCRRPAGPVGSSERLPCVGGPFCRGHEGKWVGGRCPGARLDLKCAENLRRQSETRMAYGEEGRSVPCAFKSETDTGAEIQRRAIIEVSP